MDFFISLVLWNTITMFTWGIRRKKKEMSIKNWTLCALSEILVASTWLWVYFLWGKMLSSKSPWLFFHSSNHLISLCQFEATKTTDMLCSRTMPWNYAQQKIFKRNEMHHYDSNDKGRKSTAFLFLHTSPSERQFGDKGWSWKPWKASNANPASPWVWSNSKNHPQISRFFPEP